MKISKSGSILYVFPVFWELIWINVNDIQSQKRETNYRLTGQNKIKIYKFAILFCTQNEKKEKLSLFGLTFGRKRCQNIRNT